MKSPIHTTITLAAVLTLCNAQAAGLATYNLIGSPKVAGNGSFAFGQFLGSDGTIGYAFDIRNSSFVNAFAISVTSDDAPYATGSLQSGWTVKSVHKDNWSTTGIGFFNVLGSTLGSFESLFGATDDMVLVFTAPSNIIEGPPIWNGNNFLINIIGYTPGFMTEDDDSDSSTWSAGFTSSTIPFFRSGSPNTEAIALSTTGTLIGTTVIPEPSSVLLGLLGSLALLRRRR